MFLCMHMQRDEMRRGALSRHVKVTTWRGKVGRVWGHTLSVAIARTAREAQKAQRSHPVASEDSNTHAPRSQRALKALHRALSGRRRRRGKIE